MQINKKIRNDGVKTLNKRGKGILSANYYWINEKRGKMAKRKWIKDIKETQITTIPRPNYWKSYGDGAPTRIWIKIWLFFIRFEFTWTSHQRSGFCEEILIKTNIYIYYMYKEKRHKDKKAMNKNMKN